MNTQNQKKLESRASLHPLPTVSVIIPARNAEATIESTLCSLSDQDYEGGIEVIIADGSDTPAMSELIRKRSYPKIELILIANPEKDLIPGANASFRVAGGDIIMRCDAHTVLPPSYVRRAVKTLDDTGAANVGGLQKAVGATFFEKAVALAMTTPLGVGDSRHRLGGKEGPADTAFLGTFRRETLEEMGGYDSSLIWNEDYEINYRLRKRGETVWFDPELVVEYKPRGSLWTLVRQYFNYGRGKSSVIIKHPASTRLRHLAAPGLVLALAGAAGLTFAGLWEALAIPLAYALTILGGAAVVGFRRRDAAAVLLPLVLPAMHLSWGFGFFFPARRR